MNDLAEPDETRELKAPEQIETDQPDSKTASAHKKRFGALLNRTIIEHTPPWSNLWHKHKKAILTFLVLIVLSVHCVFGIMISGFKKSKDLFGVLVFIAIIVVYVLIRDTFGKQINVLVITPVDRKIEEHWRILRWYIL